MSYWDNLKIHSEEISFLELDNVGTPVLFKVPDWEKVEHMTFNNSQGKEFSGDYLFTNKGWLRIDSKRLKRQLLAVKKSKKELSIQRWCEGSDARATIYKVEIVQPLTSVKKPTKK